MRLRQEHKDGAVIGIQQVRDECIDIKCKSNQIPLGELNTFRC